MARKYVDGIGNIINDQLNIVDVISPRVDLKKTGQNYKGLCPFHGEKTPSFIVSESKQIFKCFGCGEGGNAISFVMKSENLDFLTAIESLADRFAIDLEPYRNKDFSQGQAINRKALYELNRQAAYFYMDNLKNNEEARSYLLDRGLSEKTIISYGLGFAPDSWHSLYNLIGKDLDSKRMEDSGLFGQGARGPYDRFRDRIIFPIVDLRRRVIGFGARTMDPEGIPKYLNTADTPVFNKSYHLYGLNIAKDYRGPEKRIILVEGYMDVISLFDKGVGNAVASLGTAFTLEQGRLLERYCDELFILYDGDSAGIQATKRALEILDEVSLDVRVVTLPGGQDPDDYISAQGKEKFLDYIDKNNYDSFEYRIRDLEKNHDLDSMAGKAIFLEEVGVLLNKIKSHGKQDLYLRYVADLVGISAGDLKKDIEVVSQGPVKKQVKRRSDEAAGILMAILIQENQVAKKIYDHDWFFLMDDSWKELIGFLVEEAGFEIEKASEKFNLDQIDYMDKCSKKILAQADIKYWEGFFRRVLSEQINRRIEDLRLTPQEDKLEEIVLLQKMRIKVMSKEGGGRW